MELPDWLCKRPEKSDFTIEYYPLTKRYYPKWKNYYMRKDYCTGVWQYKEAYLFTHCDCSKTEEGAKEMIAEFAEHVLKRNVVTKQVIIVDGD